MKKGLYCVLLLIGMFPLFVQAEKKTINIYLYYGKSCPICEEEKSFLYQLARENPDIKLYEFEIETEEKNRQDMEKIKELFQISRKGVPFTVVGDVAVIGFNDTIASKLTYLVKQARKNDFRDRAGIYLGIVEEVESPTSEIESEYEEQPNEKKEVQIDTSVIVILSLIGISIFSWGLFFLIKCFRKENR